MQETLYHRGDSRCLKKGGFDTLKYFWEIFLVFLEALVDPRFPYPCTAYGKMTPRLHSPGTAYGKNYFPIMILIICTFVGIACLGQLDE